MDLELVRLVARVTKPDARRIAAARVPRRRRATACTSAGVSVDGTDSSTRCCCTSGLELVEEFLRDVVEQRRLRVDVGLTSPGSSAARPITAGQPSASATRPADECPACSSTCDASSSVIDSAAARSSKASP